MEEGNESRTRRARALRPPRPGQAPSRKWLRHQQALARRPWTEQWMRTVPEADLAILSGLLEQRTRETRRAGTSLSDEELRRLRLVKVERLRRLDADG